MRTVPAEITLDLNRIDDLFRAPAANPLSTRTIEVLGQSGISFLRKHYIRSWPRRSDPKLLIRLPVASTANDTAQVEQILQETRAAIRRYCDVYVAANHDARRLAMAHAGRELQIALVVTIVAIAILAWYVSAELSSPWSYVGGVATLMAVYAASLAIWDALESWFFDWVPFTIDNLAYRWISNLEVHVAPQTEQGTAIHE
jgi:hypothetical protein